MNPVLFHPLYKERVWGGRAIETSLGRTLPPGQVIGESWDLVDREDDQSVVRGADWDGFTLRQLIEREPEAVMGTGWNPASRFPILVKWLDCQQRLSLQVHPPAPVAPRLGGEPKTENWFVVRADPKASLIVGLKRGVTREAFEKALQEEKLETCVHRFPSRAGHSILVESGRLHAIDAGNLILEIQQNSDTTYRVYDWGRSGLDGKPRALHIEESLQSIDFDDFEPAPVEPWTEPGITTLADCSEFRIRRQNLAVGATVSAGGDSTPEIFHVAGGRLRDDNSGQFFYTGDTALLPASGKFSLTAEEDTILLRTDRFTKALP